MKDRYVETVLKPREKTTSSIIQKKYILPALLFPLLGFGMWMGFTMPVTGINDTNDAGISKNINPQQQTVTIPPTINNEVKSSDNNLPLKNESQIENNPSSNNNKLADNNQSPSSSINNKIPSSNSNLNEVTKIPDNKINAAKASLTSASDKKFISNQQKLQLNSTSGSKENAEISNNKIDETNNNNLNAAANITDPPLHTNTVQQGNGETVRTAVRRDDVKNVSLNNSASIQPTVKAAPLTADASNVSSKKKIEDFVVVNNGSQNMHLSLQNVASFPLDLTVLDIQYYDGNGRYQKGETVYVKNIPPSESVDIKVPASKNTARIRYKVSLVSSERKNLYMIAD
jgi:hypothetical protein